MSVLSARGAACLALLLACRTPSGPPAAVTPAPDAAIVAAASSASVSPFAPCTATPTAKGQTFDCGDVEAWTVQLGQMEPQAAMDMSLRALRGVVQGSGPERVSKVTLAGKQWPSAQVSACAEDARTCQVGQVVTVTGPDGAARLIGCASRGTGSTLSDRCQGMVE
ncbi:MAG TPA: hypothetical protein VK447_12750, partial [Myxococcaceae bacterium]|nr:hypothetical protein [Myxococcaceae bacterium]